MTETSFENKKSSFLGLLLIITLIVIAIISALATLLPQGTKLYSHPVYFIPWAFLALQILLYPIFIKMDSSRFGRFLLGHAPFIVLFFTVFLSLLTIRSGEIRIKQGETLQLKESLAQMGIPLNDPIAFSLLGGEVRGSDIKTRYFLNDGKSTHKGTIAVNKSLRLGNIRFYQQSGGLGVREIRFSVDGKEFDLFDLDKEPIHLSSDRFLMIAPLDLVDKSLSYKWEIFDHAGQTVDEGQFIPYGEGIYHNSFFNIKILKEDYLFITILQVVYAPLAIPLGVIAVIFLILLAWKLWGRKNDPS